jgi:solute carrier family 38 (sodium-coupled neutral amino acid transporter), member 11
MTALKNAVSLVTCDLGVMLEITGGVSATAFAFIFPAACYLHLAHRDRPWFSGQRLPAFLCVGFGICVLVVSLVLALGKMWTPAGDPKICV